MRALVTGGAGFVGSHLTQVLLERGCSVAVIDDLSTGSMHNIHGLKGEANFHYVLDTVLNRRLMAELIDETDVIFHLAAAVGVRLVVEKPVHTIETNIKGTEVVLDLAAKKGKLVVLFSTSEVYGKSGADRFGEDGDLILGPPSRGRWCYAASKLIDEFLGLSYHKERNLPVIIVRLFNTVGPRQTDRYGMVLPRFVRQALTGRPITVFGDGKQTRTFTHVRDAVGAIVGLSEHPAAIGDIFNIGGREEISIENLAHLVNEVLGTASPIQYVPYRDAYGEGFEDMARRVPDLAKIHRLLGYQPKLDLRDIIRDVGDYLRQELTLGNGGVAPA